MSTLLPLVLGVALLLLITVCFRNRKSHPSKSASADQAPLPPSLPQNHTVTKRQTIRSGALDNRYHQLN